jgi:hypothetical protein
MTIWEKAVLNAQKGVQKVSLVAAAFSERVKAEIAIVRLRIRINDIQTRIDGSYKAIGRIIVELTQSDQVPKTTEQLLKHDSIAAALADLAERRREMEDLITEMKSEQEAVKPVTEQPEDTSL